MEEKKAFEIMAEMVSKKTTRGDELDEFLSLENLRINSWHTDLTSQLGSDRAAGAKSETIQVQERFFLKLLMALVIFGDEEQCLTLCKKYFFKDDGSLNEFSVLFQANVRRIRGLAMIMQALDDSQVTNLDPSTLSKALK